MGSDNTSNAQTNVLKLVYQDKDEPTYILKILMLKKEYYNLLMIIMMQWKN